MRSLVFFCLALSSSAALAASPSLGLPHMGRLLSEDDQPIQGQRELTFTLYRTPAGGELVWQEKRRVLFDSNGHYSLTLGDPSVSGSPPLSQDLFDGVLYLGIGIEREPELIPRLQVGLVPFAARAERANTVDGGTIRNATISASTLSGVTVNADSITTASLSATNVQLQGNVSVTSSSVVSNLNAEMVGGLKAEELWTKSDFDADELLTRAEFTDTDFQNLVNNGNFENWDGASTTPSDALPNRYSPHGDWSASAQSGVKAVTGFASARALAIADGDTTKRLGVSQRLLSHVDGLQGRKVSLSARVRKISGAQSVSGQLCLSDSNASRTCGEVSATAWTQLTLTHTISPAAEYLELTLHATGPTDSDTAEVHVDQLMVALGGQPLAFRPSLADATPSGLIAYYQGTCPDGWVEVTQARGRTVVATPAGGIAGASIGTALGAQGAHRVSLTNTHLPAHAHSIPVLSGTAASAGEHLHSVDPPQASTNGNSGHSHTVYASANDRNDSGSQGYPLNNNHNSVRSSDRGGTHGLNSGALSFENAHTHTMNIPAFDSASAGAHTHSVSTVANTTGSTGAGSPLDVTMPYIQLTACRAL